MVRKVLIFLSTLLVILLVVGFALFLYYQPTFHIPTPQLDYQIRIHGGEVIGWQEGEVRWRLLVKEMEEMKENLVIFSGGTYGEFYRKGEVEYTIRSEVIQYYPKTKDLEFIGSVLLTTKEGDTLESHLLLWDDNLKELTSPGPVKLLSKGNRLEAERMKIYQQEDIFDFWDHVILSVPLSGQGRDKGEEEDE